MIATRLTSRALLRIAPQEQGEDAAGFLQGLLTHDVNGAGSPGPPVYAALLSPQGKCLFDLLVWRDGEAMLLDCEAARADELARRLRLYRLRRKLEIGPDETLGVHWAHGDQAASLAPAHAAPDPRLAALGRRWLAPARDGEAPADAAWLAHRLSLGVAEGQAELGDVLWLETNAAELNGVSFSKGCYVGQENTARMNWRQKINRRLVVVALDRSDPKRRKAAYPALGLAVDHLRLDEIVPQAAPGWLAPALAASAVARGQEDQA